MVDCLTRTLVVGRRLSSSGSSKAFVPRNGFVGGSVYCEVTNGGTNTREVCRRGKIVDEAAGCATAASLHKERRVSAQNVAGARRVSIGSIIPRASLGSPGSRNLTEHEQ